MTKNLYLIDTCSFARQFIDPACAALFDDLIRGGRFVLSAIVAMELYAGTKNKTVKQSLDRLVAELHKIGMVVTPQYDDYQKSGVLLRSYSQRKGDVKVSSHFRDILISLNAIRAGAAVVTDNTDDFSRWKKEIERNFQKHLLVMSTAELLKSSSL